MAAADYRMMTEATGQRIAAALEALHLATVTGVKGDTEQNYRHGDVNLTPANIGAVAKTGDTMTGALTAPYMVAKSDDWRFYLMQDANGSDIANMRSDHQTHRIIFREMTPGTNSAYEDYYIPIPTNQSSGISYDILTTKSAVTIPQGGTGMTDAEIFTQYTTILWTDANGRIRISRWGKMFIAHIAGACSVAITANVTPMLSLTDSNYAPNSEVWATFTTLSNEPFRVYINSSGNLYSYKNFEQDTWIYGEIMWFAGK